MEGKSGFTMNIKNIVLIIAGVVTLFFFLPVFSIKATVMERSESVSFNAIDLMTGKIQGESVGESHPLAILMLLLPVAILVMWFLKEQVTDHIKALVSVICASVDLLGWLIMSSSASGVIDVEFASVSAGPNFLYWLDMLLIIALIFLNAIILAKKVSPADPPAAIVGFFKSLSASGDKASEGPGPVIGSDKAPAGPAKKPDDMKYCMKCGKLIPKTSRFCGFCGFDLDSLGSDAEAVNKPDMNRNSISQAADDVQTSDESPVLPSEDME